MTDSIITPLAKRCTTCNVEFPATSEHFYRQKWPNGEYTLRGACKKCFRERESRTRHDRRSGLEPKPRRVTAREINADPDACIRPDISKTCITCGTQYPSTPTYFHRSRGYSDGLHPNCKRCVRAMHKEYYARPDIVERVRKYQQTEVFRSYQKQYAHRPEVKARAKARSEEPEAKRYHELYRKAYWQRPEVKAQARLRNFNRRSAPGSFTTKDIEAIRKAQGNRCYICHKKLGKKYHIDHFIPIKLGGTNDPGNLRLACPKCNLSKGPKHPHDLGILI